MEFTAPAKINLYLKVIQRRNDGYHDIETLFERISIFDRISIEPAEDQTSITCDDPCVPTDGNSLLGRVVTVFREKLGADINFRITLEKNIPIGAGLGGGSSDAATLLKALNQLTGFPFEKDALLRVARGLGADIPFFLSDCSFAYGMGRGDIIQKVETSQEIWHVLVNPPFEVSTKEVYGRISALDLTEDMGVDRIFTAFLNEKNIREIAKNLRNDLQEIVLRDFSVLGRVFSELRDSGAEGVLLSGSGPTIFGIFDQEKAIEAGDRLRQIFPAEENWRIIVARTC